VTAVAALSVHCAQQSAHLREELMKYWLAAVLIALGGPVLAANTAPLYWTY